MAIDHFLTLEKIPVIPNEMILSDNWQAPLTVLDSFSII